MIEIKALSKFYGPQQVLEDISLSLEPGKVYGIVGENGSGKTTLFKCMVGLESYFGQISSPFDPLKDEIGFLLTDPYFFPLMTGKEYLQLLANARQVKVGDLTVKNVFHLPLDQYASTYSTGMKKKLALLGILLLKNEVYILDEPFNGVDIQSNILITAIIHQLKALGKTVLISSHIFSTLQETCDEIHVLHQGRLVKKVAQADFAKLDEEMKAVTIGDRLDRLAIQ